MAAHRYRIGNDITVLWAINNRDGSPYDLAGKDVRLYVTHGRGRDEVKAEKTTLPDGVINNVLRWDFKGASQRVLGKYTLSVSIHASDDHREVLKDYCEAFELVARSDMEDEEGEANLDQNGNLILSSRLDIYAFEMTSVDVSGIKLQIDKLEEGIVTKVGIEEFSAKTGEIEEQYTSIRQTTSEITAEIKSVLGEVTQVKTDIDGISVSVGDLESSVKSLEKQAIGAIETWFHEGAPTAETFPESEWQNEDEKTSHIGDLYYDENTGYAYRYTYKDGVFVWTMIKNADIIAALELARQNNRTFLDCPTTPYKAGDIWIAEKDYPEAKFDQNDILVCVNSREAGDFDIADWEKKGGNINDEDIEDFVDRYYNETILPEISSQIDKAASSYYQSSDPSEDWEVETYEDHAGDLWYNTTAGRAYYWTGSSWTESNVPEEVFDKIDGKSTIYANIPSGVSYKENDLWFTERDYNEGSFVHKKGEVLVAIEDALYDEGTGAYVFNYSDWVKKDSYTDDTAVESLDTYIKTSFRDGILDEGEKKSIKASWDAIRLAQEEVTNDYLTVLLAGTSLTDGTFEKFQVKYKILYSEESPSGKYQVLEDIVNRILEYEVNEEEPSGLAELLTEYDDAYDGYRTALSDYTVAYAMYTNALRAHLGEATEYIEAIVDDGRLTPIEKKQLLQIYKALAAEYNSNVDSAFNAKIWKWNDDGEEAPGIYSGPDGEGDEYYVIYVEYKEAYYLVQAIFTSEAWGFDNIGVTTVFDGDINLAVLQQRFDGYYAALEKIANVLSLISKEKDEANDAMKQYISNLEEHLLPSEAITQIGKGVILSSIIGVGTYDALSGDFLLKAGLNATRKNDGGVVTYDDIHGRVLFAGGLDNQQDWNKAVSAIYEDGYVHFRWGKIDEAVEIGEAMIHSVLADDINLLSYPQVNPETGEKELIPLFQVNTDDAGRIVSISSVYDLYVNGNLIVTGDTATGGTGEDTPSTGGGIDEDELAEYLTDNNYVNSVATLASLLGYTPVNPSSLATVATSGSYTDLSNKPTSMKSPYALAINNSAGTAQVSYDGSATKSLTLTKSMVGLGNVDNLAASGYLTALSSNTTNAVSITVGGTTKTITAATMKTSLGLGSLAYKSSLVASDIPDLSGSYLPLSGGWISNSGADFITINRTDGNPVLTYNYNGSFLGRMGFNTNGSPVAQVSGAYYPLLHEGNIGSYNAGSATKLATARTIWGQSFDGSADVSGSLNIYKNSSGYTAGWARHINVRNSANTILSAFGFYGTGETLEYAYIGPSYSSPQVSILPSGNVGIREAYPAYTLEVGGTGRFSGAVTMGSTLSVNGNLTTNSNVLVGNDIAGALPSGSSYRRWRITMSDPATWIQAASFDGMSTAGNLYLTGYQAATLASCMIKATATTITGTLAVSGQTTISNNLIVSGDTATGSDIRFKDIIEDRTIDIRAMADAPLFTFTWNDREDDKVHLGTSAQYWERVAPWLVKGEDFKHLDYSTLGVAMAVSLAKKTVDIEDRVKVLEKENEALKAEIRRIQNGAIC